MPSPLTQGARVVVQAKPDYWTQRGSLMMDLRQIRPVGVGELLARIEYLKQHLRSEGLFEASRKRVPPFLPRRVGLVCGRGSAAERDVVENARRRWPGLPFDIRQVAVQGSNAVSEVSGAVAALDSVEDVDAIIVTRGGGSVEALLPFSNETMVRAVADARTPVVSAIGHDVDTPLLDLVADVRASTPTDAAKLVCPDAATERAGVADARERTRAALTALVGRERRALVELTSRPVLTDRTAFVRAQREVVDSLHRRAHTRIEARVH